MGVYISIQSPRSVIDKEEKGDRIKEKAMVDQEEVGSHNLPTISISDLLDNLDRDLQSVLAIVQRQIELQIEWLVEQQRLRFGQRLVLERLLDWQLDWQRLVERLELERPLGQLERQRLVQRLERLEQLERQLLFEHSRLDVEPKQKELDLNTCAGLIVLKCGYSRNATSMAINELRNRGKTTITGWDILKEPFSFKDQGISLPPDDDAKENDKNRMLKMHLLKNYSMLKEELNWLDIISIADDLYIDGHLNWHERQDILDRSQPRRKAIDILLKAVLRNASSVSAFMKIMKSKSTLSYIAMRINMTQISAEEMERFDHLEEISQGQRPSIYQEPSQKFHLSDSDVGFLISHFYGKEEVIDQISDLMLSNFLISTCHHKGIFEHAHMDEKILELTELIKTCPDAVYDIFIAVLMKNNMQYVLPNLERNRKPDMKRKYLSFDPANPPVQKRMKINHNQKGSALDALEKIASGLRVSTIRQKLGNEARKHLDLEFKEAFWGSLGLMFSFQVGEPLQKLKQLVA